jgi:ubiquinone/menaquinone biosynthesis C-methylase UbiE
MMAMNAKESVLDRYSEGAKERQESLCCPVSYDTGLLAMLPDEIIEKDYGCGDPSRYVQEGDVVLDLGSGGGKICYMAAQLVGKTGQVIGMDMNNDMLALARKYQAEMAARLGSDRVSFVKGHIQDLGLSIEALDEYLQAHPVNSHEDYAGLKTWETAQRSDNPLVQDKSVDLVISNCVLNLVDDHEKQHMIREIFRVLKPGGRVAISDIVSDRPIPEKMKNDPGLWSGCISGAFREGEFLHEFTAAGFSAVSYDKWDTEPWQVIEGIEFRAVTLTAVKPEAGDNQVDDQGLIYRGPFAAVVDDNGQTYVRGQRVNVSGATRKLLVNPAFNNAFIDLSTPVSGVPGRGCCSSGESTLSEPSSSGCC